MTDRTREALFSTLGERVAGADILDLYSGSGALGIEALSRGAASATFVERDPRAVATIRSNLELTKLQERARVFQSSVESYLDAEGQVFDVVFVDPPFRIGLPEEVLARLSEGRFVDTDTTLVVQVPARDAPEEVPAPFVVQMKRRYGDSYLLYLKKERI